MEPQVLGVSIGEAARCLGISPRTVAYLISRKELPSRRIGRRRIIPVSALHSFLARDHTTGASKQRVGVVKK